MKTTNRPPPRSSQQVDWVRTTYLTAIFGAIFWAVALRIFAIDHGLAATVVAAATVTALVVGLVLQRRSTSITSRSLGAAVAMAPFIGVAPLVPLAFIELATRLA